MTTQPAGEHHTGTLNLTGQGNPAASPISDDLVQIAERAYETFGAGMRDALEAAYPAIRQQVAEQIAAAIEELRDRGARTPMPRGFLSDAAKIAREIGGRE